MQWNPIMRRKYTCLINEFPNSHRGSKIQHHCRGWEWHCPNIVIENNQYCFAISYIRYIFILLKIIVHLIKIHKQQRSYKHVKTLNGFWLIVVKITQKLIFKRQFFTVWARFAIVGDDLLMSLWYIQILTCLKCLIVVQWCNTVGLLCCNTNCWPVVTFFSANSIIRSGQQEGIINIFQVLQIITLLIYISFTSYI